MNIDTIVSICFAAALLTVFIVGPIALMIYSRWANDIRWEDKMLPCPKCGHRAITVHYTGENNPYFFTAECGAYVRRGEDSIGSVGGIRRRNDPPMTEAQKKCNFCAGYCAEVPHFVTRRGAVKWWNSLVEKERNDGTV